MDILFILPQPGQGQVRSKPLSLVVLIISCLGYFQAKSWGLSKILYD